jgi:hypothetical protein
VTAESKRTGPFEVLILPGESDRRYQIAGLPGHPILSRRELVDLCAKIIHAVGPLQGMAEVKALLYGRE